MIATSAFERAPVRGAWVERHAGMLVALATALLCLPFTNVVWILADEGIWLHAGMRMLAGQLLYRDFFEFHPPIGFLMISGWMGLFGPSLLAARLLMVVLIAATAWLGFACCRLVTGRAGLSAMLVLGWAVAVPGPWMQVNHHWFTSFWSMLALWALLAGERRKGLLALAGFAASAATLVTTHRGGMIAVAGLVAVVRGRSLRDLMLYAGSGLALLGAVLVFLWAQGTLIPAYEQIVVYALGHYADIQGVPYGAFVDPQTMFVVAGFPVTGVLLAVAAWRERGALLGDRPFGTVLLFALVGFAGCFPRPDAVHIAFCAVLALPLLAMLIDRLGTPRWLRMVGLCAVLLPLSLPLAMAVQGMKAPRIDVRAGRVGVVPPTGIRELLARLNGLPAGDKVFFYPADPVLPFLTGRDHVARLDMLVPQYSTPEQYAQTCAQVMAGAQWVVFHDAITTPDHYRAVFPAMTDPSPREKVMFEAALRRGFGMEARYGNFTLLRRGAGARVGFCDGVSGA